MAIARLNMTGLELMGIFLCGILICIVLYWFIWNTATTYRLDNNYDELTMRVRMLENHALTSNTPTKKKTK